MIEAVLNTSGIEPQHPAWIRGPLPDALPDAAYNELVDEAICESALVNGQQFVLAFDGFPFREPTKEKP